MSYDLQIVPQKQGEITFNVIGKSADTGLLLLQRLYILMLTDQSTAYRNAGSGYALINLLQGGNIPADPVLDSILAICCSNAVSALDASDKQLVSSFVGKGVSGVITCTLKLKDGTTITGTI